jgi:uncharacterized membrane protein YphA (DoxX/SURF4 family)
MKKTNILYWVFTGLLSVLMLFSSIPNIISNQQSVDLLTHHLGYPAYFIPFIGVAKLLGVVAILIPRFPRLKEWAYAGFMFDLLGAIYSTISVGDTFANWAPMLIGPALITCSYIFYHKKLKAGSSAVAK